MAPMVRASSTGGPLSGTRPEFKVVTGVSTGALIAPFAFLGPKYDYVLERVYTTTSQKDIFKKRGWSREYLATRWRTAGRWRMSSRLMSISSCIDEIAAEYAKGRVLLVGTANLDSLEPVIWNMTAIAASKDPDTIPLFRNILLASASIPGAFPPVLIDVNVGGTRYQEMHVDGGTMAQVFFYPPSVNLSELGADSSASGSCISFATPGWTSIGRASSGAPCRLRPARSRP